MATQRRVFLTLPAVAWCLLMASLAGGVVLAFWGRESIVNEFRGNSFSDLLQQAREASQRGQTDVASVLFKKLTDGYPSKEEGLLAYAEYLDGHALQEQADEMYARAVNAGPQRYGSVSRYAYFLDRIGKRDRAIEMCRSYLSRHPDDVWAQYELGLRLLWQRNWEDCEPYLLKATTITSLFLSAKSRLGESYMARGMYAEALRTWTEAVDAGNALENKQLLYDMASARVRLGDIGGAAELLERHLAHFPRSLWAATELRGIYGQLGNASARDRLDLLIRSMSPALFINKEIALFIKVRGITPPTLSFTPGASATLDVFFEFLSTLTPAESPEARFWMSPGKLGEGNAYVQVSSDTKRLGTPPFWRGDCLIQTFAVTAPAAIDAGTYHLALALGPDSASRTDLCEIGIAETPEAVREEPVITP